VILLILAAGLVAAQVSAPPAVGLAMTGGAGPACVAIPGATLPPGSIVTLLAPDSPRGAVTAVIGEAISTCALDEHVTDGPYYRLQPRVPVPEHLAVWLAFPGELATRTAAAGGVTVRVSAQYPDVQGHSCTSSEGVHYTVWTGTPLDSRRLWHAYFYLGYDVEPSCKQRSEVED
jgi:hypothetical protein